MTDYTKEWNEAMEEEDKLYSEKRKQNKANKK